jgi:DNA-directed RNA polymerase subunit RPC12/RpoP
MNVIRIRSFTDSIEANIAKAKLQADGIACFLTNENFSVLQPGLSGQMTGSIDLMINEEDLEKAKEILDDIVEDASYKCPHCGSKNIIIRYGKNALSRFFLILAGILFAFPINRARNEYFCRTCRKSFPHPEENE